VRDQISIRYPATVSFIRTRETKNSWVYVTPQVLTPFTKIYVLKNMIPGDDPHDPPEEMQLVVSFNRNPQARAIIDELAKAENDHDK
jgi:hypothetical protein